MLIIVLQDILQIVGNFSTYSSIIKDWMFSVVLFPGHVVSNLRYY